MNATNKQFMQLVQDLADNSRTQAGDVLVTIHDCGTTVFEELDVLHIDLYADE